MASHPGFEPGRSRRVDVGVIEQELRRLWKAAVEAGEGPGVTRACALNLVALAEDVGGGEPARWERLPELIAEITAEHPCRVFQVRARPRAGSAGITAHVSAHCHRPAGTNRQVCCEQISLEASGGAAEHLHGTIAPLLVEDLPVFLWWWGEPPFETHRFERLARLADRLLVDTGAVASPVAMLGRLARWSREPPAAGPRARPGDLNWRRLSAWRELVAAIFDAPARRPALAGLRRVALCLGAGDVEADAARLVRAFYLLGWLASRLGWSAREKTARLRSGVFRMELDAGTHVVGTELALDGHPGTFSLVLESDGDGPSLTAVLDAPAGSRSVRCRVECAGHEPAVREETIRDTKLSHLVMRELELSGHDRPYEAALQVAGTLARIWERTRGASRGRE